MTTVIMHELEPVTQSGSLSDEVARRLRSAIKDGDFPPGTRLVEQEIAKQLLVSRMPVRTALQKLIEEGLVIKEPRRGAFVHTYSARELDEVTSIRITLESMVVEYALPNWSDAAEVELERIFQLMLAAAQNGNRQAIIELDTAFHSLLWDLSEHSILIELVSSLRSRIGRFLAEATHSVSSPELMKHVSTHRVLIDVFRGGDIEKTKAAMTGHIVASQERIKANYAYLGQRATGNPVTELKLPTPAGT